MNADEARRSTVTMTNLGGERLPGFKAISELGPTTALYEFRAFCGPYNVGFALKPDGTVWKWETRSEFAYGNTFRDFTYLAGQVELPAAAVGLFTNNRGDYFALDREGALFAWGDEWYESLGLDVANSDTPVRVAGLPAVRRFFCGSNSSNCLAVTAQGEVYAWGSNYDGILGQPDLDSEVSIPAKVPNLYRIVDIAYSYDLGYRALDMDGVLYQWGTAGNYELEIAPSPKALGGELPRWKELGDRWAVAVDGALWLWDGAKTPPYRVEGLSGVTKAQVFNGRSHFSGEDASHTHALDEQGRLWSWGCNHSGELGDGSQVDSVVPVQTQLPTPITDFVVCGTRTYGCDVGGGLWAWGAAGTVSDGTGTRLEGLVVTPELIELRDMFELEEGSWDRVWKSLTPQPIGLFDNDGNRSMVDTRDGRTHLMHWSAVGDIRQVAAIIELGGAIDAMDDDGDTALLYAASHGHIEVVELLLQSGADAHRVGTLSLLSVAAQTDVADLVRIADVHGVNLDQRRRRDGATPLMVASSVGSFGVAHELLQRGATVDARDNDGDTAIFYAASRGRIHLVNLLLRYGADPSASMNSAVLVAANNAVLPQAEAGTTDENRQCALALLSHGADHYEMYRAGFLLARYGERGMEVIRVEHVPSYVRSHDDLSITYAPPSSGLRALAGVP